MSSIGLKIETRPKQSKNRLKHMRSQGLVPGVMYSKGGDAAAVKIDANVLEKHLRDVGTSKLVQVQSDDGALNDKYVIVREIQRDPLTWQLVHVDLQQVELDQVVKITVPIHYNGTAAGVRAGGAKNVHEYFMKVRCRAEDIPEEIDVNVEPLEIGDTLRVRDLTPPEGVEFRVPENVVLIVVEKRRKAAIVLQDEAEAAAEEAEAEGEEGSEQNDDAAGEEGSE